MPDLRRLTLFVTIGSFSVAALLGVLALLSGGGFGEGQANVLVTTVCVGVASVLALCYLGTADTPYWPVGVLGGLAAVPTLALSLLLIWTELGVESEGVDVWQAFGIGSVASLTLAQASLLLVVAARAAPYVRLLLVGTLVFAGWVALHVSLLIVAVDASDGSLRLLGVVAILDVLGTVAVSALARFGGPRRASKSPLQVPLDVVPLVVARALSTGRHPDEIVREALLAGLQDRTADTPRG